MTEAPTSGPGLTIGQFFASATDQDIRTFVDPGVLAVLDAIFGGQIEGVDLCRVAQTLVDLGTMLNESRDRQAILALLHDSKRVELEARIGRNINTSSDWTQSDISRVHEFFGLLDERIAPPILPAAIEVHPSYGLFDHQRSSVEQLLPLLTQDERRAVLHLPTGAGKTRTAMHVASELLRSNDPSVVVWLASGKELLEQAVLAFREAWTHLGNRPLQLGSMWGSRAPELSSFTDGFLAVGLAKGWLLSQGPMLTGQHDSLRAFGLSCSTKLTRVSRRPIAALPMTLRLTTGAPCLD